jgi:tol-pal system beta propeller repeat protein TolB
MSPRLYTLVGCVAVASLVASTRACGQDTATTRPGVRLGLNYPRGTTPRVIVLPVDSTPGDSIRRIIERDLDFGDRVSPIPLDDSTLRGMAPLDGGDPNYGLFAKLGAVAIVQAKHTNSGGLRVTLFDVGAGRRLEVRDFGVTGVPPVRDAKMRDSILVATTSREKAIRDSIARVLRVRAEVMRRPPLKKDTRQRRFIVRDSLRRDSAATAYVKRGLTRWEDDRRDSVQAAIATVTERRLRSDSLERSNAGLAQRMSIHRISDEVERWITGQRGIATSRLAYVHNGLIRVVDSDGANDRAVTRRGLAMSPQWHPSGRKIVFSRFVDGGTQIEELDFATGRTHVLSSAGLNITPVYSHDGRYVVYSNGTESGTDLFMIFTDSGSVPQRLTFGRGSDNTSPSFSPDGRQIAFISARSGFPQIYSMDADGTNVQLLVPFTPGVRSYRTAPDWSPDGRAVAYEQQNGDFQVWVINVRDREPRRLTSEGENEGPSWAADGRHVAISSTRGGSKQIWVLDTESGRFRQVTFNAGARLSAWSPILQPGQ